MKSPLRPPFGLLAATACLVLAACTPLDKDSGLPLETGSNSETSSPLTTLRDDSQKFAWVIGSHYGQELSGIRDEIDFPTLMRSIRAHMEGTAQPLQQDEIMTVMQAFEARMEEKSSAQGKDFLIANGTKPGVTTTSTGLQYEVLVKGNGRTPGPLDRVRVHYEGRFLDGEIFDSSYARGEPVEFHLDQVIPGWREGVLLMPVGSKYRLWIPSILAYGQTGTPGGPIGPNTTLAFDIELLDIIAAP